MSRGPCAYCGKPVPGWYPTMLSITEDVCEACVTKRAADLMEALKNRVRRWNAKPGYFHPDDNPNSIGCDANGSPV